MYTHKNCQFGKREFSGIFPLAGGILSFQNGNSRWPWFGSVRVLTKVRVRFSSSFSQVQKICVRFGFGSYILSFEYGSVLCEFGCLTVLNLTTSVTIQNRSMLFVS